MHQYQEKIYQIYKEKGELPPYRKLAKIIGVSSLSTVSHHINQLRKKGFLDIDNSPSGIAKLNLQLIFNFNSKSGVYVLLNDKIPFYIGDGENIKNHLLENVINKSGDVADIIKNNLDKISIAYYLTDNPQKRKEIKNYLFNYYPKQGIKILNI